MFALISSDKASLDTCDCPCVFTEPCQVQVGGWEGERLELVIE